MEGREEKGNPGERKKKEENKENSEKAQYSNGPQEGNHRFIGKIIMETQMPKEWEEANYKDKYAKERNSTR